MIFFYIYIYGKIDRDILRKIAKNTYIDDYKIVSRTKIEN
jgi:hypothetical protein